jgi:hypothetical protein
MRRLLTLPDSWRDVSAQGNADASQFHPNMLMAGRKGGGLLRQLCVQYNISS